MSDFDRNYAARAGVAERAVIDVGLRAYMLRVYNYMAAGVALTGVVAWLIFNAAVQTSAPGQLVLTSFGQTIYGGPVMIVLFLGTLGIVFFLSFRINRLQTGTALALFMLYAGLLGVMLLELAPPGALSPVWPIALLIVGINAIIAMLLPYAAGGGGDQVEFARTEHRNRSDQRGCARFAPRT